MSTLKELKKYLVGNGGYLLNDDNNAKTVMLSGAWGSGKTHFWLEDIKPQLLDKKQKNIYISLYGKESIGELKFEVLREAYNLEVKEDIISKTASMLSSIAPGLGEKSLVDGFDKLNKKAKGKKAEEILKSGSIICLDDFERKSKNIDLNDLFGYISQLALDYHCKVVIILNSDVFKGEEANVFKTVKEKTVNKFFYFKPEIEELFNSIYESNKKYKELDDYRNKILNAIEKTEELNARIYIQVLDNCLEWIEKQYTGNVLKALVFTTVYFLKTHSVLKYADLNFSGEYQYYEIKYNMYNFYPEGVFKALDTIQCIDYAQYSDENSCEYYISKEDYVDKLNEFDDDYIISEIERRILGDKNYSEVSKQTYLDYLYDNENNIIEFWKYGYRLYYMDTVDETIYKNIANFVETGILSKNKELSS